MQYDWKLSHNQLHCQCDRSSPGVKGDSVQEGTVVVVPDIIPSHRLAWARLGHHLVLNGEVILWVVNVHQQDIEHQGRLGGNICTWWAEDGEFQTSHLPILERNTNMKDKWFYIEGFILVIFFFLCYTMNYLNLGLFPSDRFIYQNIIITNFTKGKIW